MLKRSIIFSIIALAAISCTNKSNVNAKQTTDSILLTKDSLSLALESMSLQNSLYLLVGTYTSTTSEGIYVYQFDTVSGYSNYKSMTKIENPSYLTISKDEKYVYAVTENNDNTAAANAFSFHRETGELRHLNTQPVGGGAPCYIEIDNSGKHIVTANYSGGSISLFETNDDGSLKPSSQIIKFQGKSSDPNRQKQPHLHCVRYSPDGKYLFADDLGTDKIHKFEINTSNPESYIKVGEPPFTKVKDGSGPRHLDFHSNGKYAYLINEISGAVIAFNYKNGNLTEFQTIQADTLNAQGSGDIHISPDGLFLYASNRLKGDGIAIFTINKDNGQLTKVGYQETGIHPRNFVITPNGKHLLVANRDSNNIQVFERDLNTGLLTNANKDIKLDMPVCLKFVSIW